MKLNVVFCVAIALICLIPCPQAVAQGEVPSADTPLFPPKLPTLPPAEKAHPALAEFNAAVEAIRKGNEAQTAGNQDDAYCYYDEAVMRLNGIKGKYPDWERDKVMKQIKNVLDVKEKLVAVVCKDHEEMKQGRFRFLVWQRQVAMLRKLDVIAEKLERMEKEIDDNRKDIKDIRQVLMK